MPTAAIGDWEPNGNVFVEYISKVGTEKTWKLIKKVTLKVPNAIHHLELRGFRENFILGEWGVDSEDGATERFGIFVEAHTIKRPDIESIGHTMHQKKMC